MATTKTKSRKEISSTDIITLFMDYVLEHGKYPKTIYSFCKEGNFTESEFYQHFGSFESLKEGVWEAFYNHTLIVLEKDKNYDSYVGKEKMLSFFFTFFELLTANRSYALFVLHEHKNILGNLKQLQALRIKVRHFASELIETANEEKTNKLAKNPVGLFGEGAWVQTLLLLKYWMNDNSPGFEKTDMAIEKSVSAVFDVFQTTPLESIIDLGKFIVKEHFSFASK